MVSVQRSRVDYLGGNGATPSACVMVAHMNTAVPFGHLLRQWRQRRRLSQLEFACEAEISSKHLSFLETGRAQPSREMLLRLAEILEVPLRERNIMLIAAGHSPQYQERSLHDPALRPARAAVDQVLKAHEPFPALAVDRYWTMVAANAVVPRMLGAVSPQLLEPPVNVLRLSLHPEGLAPAIVNLSEWRAHLLARLRREIEVCADPSLAALYDELQAYASPARRHSASTVDASAVAVPLKLAIGEQVLCFISTTTVFGTPTDVTLSELALECFYPTDEPTAERLRALCKQ